LITSEVERHPISLKQVKSWEEAKWRPFTSKTKELVSLGLSVRGRGLENSSLIGFESKVAQVFSYWLHFLWSRPRRRQPNSRPWSWGRDLGFQGHHPPQLSDPITIIIRADLHNSGPPLMEAIMFREGSTMIRMILQALPLPRGLRETVSHLFKFPWTNLCCQASELGPVIRPPFLWSIQWEPNLLLLRPLNMQS